MKNLILAFSFISLFLTHSEQSFGSDLNFDKNQRFQIDGVSDPNDPNCKVASIRMFDNANKQCSLIQATARPVGRIRPILTYENSCMMLATFDCNGQ